MKKATTVVFINNISLWHFPIIVVVLLLRVPVYYFNGSISLIKFIEYFVPIIRVNFYKKIRGHRYRDCEMGWAEKPREYLENFFKELSTAGEYLESRFQIKKSLLEKIKISSLSLLSEAYDEQGSIALYFMSHHPEIEKIIYLQSSLKNFIFRGCNELGVISIWQIYWPQIKIGNLKFCTLARLKEKLRPKSGSSVSRPKSKILVSEDDDADSKVLNIFVHEGFSFGNLYEKKYFLENIQSDLRLVKKNFYKLGNGDYCYADVLVRGLSPETKITDIYICMKLFFVLIFKYKMRPFAVSLVALLLFRMLAWRHCFSRSLQGSVALIDYDLLFSKAALLALESLELQTFAFQERTASAYSFSSGSFFDFYFVPSETFRSLISKNWCHCHAEVVVYDQLRSEFFLGVDWRSLADIRFEGFGNRLRPEVGRTIVVGGYFLGNQLNCFLNESASSDFLQKIRQFSQRLPNFDVVVRFKILDKDGLSRCRAVFDGVDNLFVCSDYRQPLISYRLIRESRLFISHPTSLVEEAVVMGCPVIVLDSFSTMDFIATDTYPEFFRFMIREDLLDCEWLIEKIFANDGEYFEHFFCLREKVSSGAFRLNGLKPLSFLVTQLDSNELW